MSKVLEKVESLEAKAEEKKRELETAERNLEVQIEARKKELEEAKKALEEARWEERLKRVEKEIGPFYREEKDKEDEINRQINKVFNNASRAVKKINLAFKGLKDLEKKISSLGKKLIQSSEDDESRMREAIEFKKAEVTRELEIAELVKGGSSLVRAVNIAMGIQGEREEDLFGSGFNGLPLYAQNIYNEIKMSRGRPVRARVNEWIRVARIPDPRIIKAREELKKNLEILSKKNLVEYEEEGDILTVREETIE